MQQHELSTKSSIAAIESRFNDEVERFSNLETAQRSLMDAALGMALITEAAVRSTRNIKHVLDIGCGAGNNTLKLLQHVPHIDCDLVDLSLPMLDKATQRISQIITGKLHAYHADFRTLELPQQHYDVIIAAAVLHHLRDDEDWESVFRKIYQLTAVGGSVWITDLVSHEIEAVDAIMRSRHAQYLQEVGGAAFKEKVLRDIEQEDSPRTTLYQLELLKKVGFSQVELLHKNTCFVAFGAIKA